MDHALARAGSPLSEANVRELLSLCAGCNVGKALPLTNVHVRFRRSGWWLARRHPVLGCTFGIVDLPAVPRGLCVRRLGSPSCTRGAELRP